MTLKDYISHVSQVAASIRQEYGIQDDDILRDAVFSVLEKKCIVLYYPIENEKNRGFYTKRFVINKLESFVYINTDKPLSDQVFTAAHELGHVIDIKKRIERLTGQTADLSYEEEEDLINRFAAEFLMPENQFRSEFHICMESLNLDPHRITVKNFIHVVVLMMNEFMVPYEAVRRRLVETHLISCKIEKFMLEQDKLIDKMVRDFSEDLNSALDRPTGKKTIPGFRAMLMEGEKSDKIDKALIKKVRSDFDIESHGETEKTNDILNINSGE